MGKKESCTIVRKGRGYVLTVTGGNGSTVIHIAGNGTLRDLSGAAIDGGDVKLVIDALRGIGEANFASLVVDWWELNKL